MYRRVNDSEYFGGMLYLFVEGCMNSAKRVVHLGVACLLYLWTSQTLKMKTPCSSETSGLIQQKIRLYDLIRAESSETINPLAPEFYFKF
jgi:hypothetical protein